MPAANPIDGTPNPPDDAPTTPAQNAAEPADAELDLIAALKNLELSTRLRNIVDALSVVRLEGSVTGGRRVVLGVSDAMRAEAENKFDQLRTLIGRIHEGGVQLELAPPTAPAVPASPPPAETELTEDRVREAMSDPLVAQAADLFDARIVRVEPRKET
jgi:hypothetical protein